jgi:hypothetical protein
MSKMTGQTFRYCFGNETKTFWYCSRICLVKNRNSLVGEGVGGGTPNSDDGTDTVVL